MAVTDSGSFSETSPVKGNDKGTFAETGENPSPGGGIRHPEPAPLYDDDIITDPFDEDPFND